MEILKKHQMKWGDKNIGWRCILLNKSKHVVSKKDMNCRNITWTNTYIHEGVMQNSTCIIQGNEEAYRTVS